MSVSATYMKKNFPPFVISAATFLFIMLFFILGIILQKPYQAMTRPYFHWLNTTGYYEHVYQADCHRHCFFQNFPHEAPYLLFVWLPLIGSFVALYYYFSNDKRSLKKLLKLNTRTHVDATKPMDVNNKKHMAMVRGIIIAFFFLIGVLFVLPLLGVLVSGLFHE